MRDETEEDLGPILASSMSVLGSGGAQQQLQLAQIVLYYSHDATQKSKGILQNQAEELYQLPIGRKAALILESCVTVL